MSADGKFFVGALSRDVTSTESLRAYFEQFGELVDAVVMIKGGRSRGFGFITYANPALLPADFLSTVHIVDGKQVDLKPAVPEEETMSTKLFVGALSPATTTEMLQAYFSQFGTVTDAVAMFAGGQPRCFGFVEFATSQEAFACLKTPNHIIDNKVVDVKKAEPRPGEGFAPAMPMFGGFAPRFRGAAFGARAPLRTAYGAQAAFPRSAAAAPVSINTAKLFVGGLLPESTEDSLLAYFSQFGAVVECEIMRRAGGLSRGFGFVSFSRPAEARAALAPHFHVIDGKAAEVKACLPKEIAPPAARYVAGGIGGARFAPRAAFAGVARPFVPRARAMIPRYRPY